MSKYDFELDLENDNTMSLINEMINSNTRVLEFGCATGRLTRHLKENKGCKVTIVEIDREAGEIAAQYAEQSFIGVEEGNIEEYIWEKKISQKYDYIIFADVLEHLYKPEEVLNKCKNYLSENGSIIVSIPNIAHNSVVIDLINNKFEYQSTGLLDDTHIRFFTYESFKEMIRKNELVVIKEQATYSKVGENEFKNTYNDISAYIAREIKKRRSGNTYQYVFEIKDKYCLGGQIVENNIMEYAYCDYYASLFIKGEIENDFTNVIPIREKFIPVIGVEKTFSFILKESQEVELLRFDPIEENVIVKIESIKIYDKGVAKEVDIKTTNAFTIVDDIYIFTTQDPQFQIECKKQVIDRIDIVLTYMDYEIPDTTIINLLVSESKRKESIIEQKENYIVEQRGIIEQKENYIVEQRGIIEQKENYIVEQRGIIEQKENYIAEQRKVINSKEQELESIKQSKYYKVYSMIKEKVRGKAK